MNYDSNALYHGKHDSVVKKKTDSGQRRRGISPCERRCYTRTPASAEYLDEPAEIQLHEIQRRLPNGRTTDAVDCIYMAPENSWQVSLDEDGDLICISSEGTETSQPARNFWQRVQDSFFKLFPQGVLNYGNA
jgi:hypothetical protein